MAIKKLNDRQVKAAKPRLRKENPINDQDFVEYALNDGGGLYLLVKPSGAKSWSFLYRSPVTGKNSRLGLGMYPMVSLAAARERVEQLWELVARGHDPRDVEKAEKAAQAAAREKENDTFGLLAKQWFDETSSARNWGEGHKVRQWGLLKNWANPALQDLPISVITKRQVADMLRGVVARGRGETALRVRAAVRDVFSYADNIGIIDVPSFMSDEGLARLVTPEKVRFPAITKPDELGKLLRAMHGYEGRGVTVHAALNLLPLLAQRPGQVMKMEWKQIDLERAIWTVPAEIMKMKQAEKDRRPDFIVPLPRQAVSILRELHKYTGDKDYVFASHKKGRHLSENTLGAALRALGYDTKKEHTPHGFRSTFLTLAQEKFGAKVAVAADRHLGHVPKIEGAASNLSDDYNRAMLLNDRIPLLQRWADYLDELRDGPAIGNVVQLATRAA